jgi:hypothetical protein
VALITWPSTLLPERMAIQLVQVSGGSDASPYSGRRNFFRLPNGYWRASLSWTSAREAQWRDIQGFVATLGGRAGRFLLADPGYSGPRGGNTGGSVTATGSLLASTVTLAGLGGTNPALKRGDRLSIGERLYMVTADVTHSGGGATVSIAPRLRAACTSAAVTLAAPIGTFSLVDDQQGAVSLRPPLFAEVSIDLVEPI